MSNKALKEAVSWLLHIAVAVALGLSIIVFVGRFAIVDGSSMAPTLKNRDVIIIESLTQRFGTIKTGDIVVLKIPELLSGKKEYAIKRVIATEGQHVEIKDGSVFVDGRKLTENYINGRETQAANSLYDNIIVPEGCIYVLGDNRIPGKSHDSRTFGPVSSDRIIGKCLLRIFPFSDAGIVK
ncbi:MAG: signal peptidase I [Clostridiaceae bacterium]|nr:signal peptidase I [Clostridiaceae bacterium]